MAKRIEKSFIDEINRRTDIGALIGSKLSYKKSSGHNSWACCPFHNEKTPSFCVDHQKQFYYCFGCKASGDALRFVMDYDHLPFVEAVEYLARFNGMEVRYEEESQLQYEVRMEQKARVELGLEALQKAADFYHQCFYQDEAEVARGYLRSRSVKNVMVQKYQIGYAPRHNALLHHLEKNYALDLLQETGLIAERDGQYYDWFRDRIMFPIHNSRGQVIAFGARAMGDAQPKYLNSGDSSWFNKRHELYGLHHAMQVKAKTLIVTEGYMDVVKLAQFGFENAVAALGTAFGETHVQQLKKRANKIYVCFDGDLAGQTAAQKALQAIFAAYDEQHEWRFMFMPVGEDPDSLLSREGKEAFHQAMDASLTPSQFLQQILGTDERQLTVEERAQRAASAAQWLGLLPSGGYREILQQELQAALSVPVHVEQSVAAQSQDIPSLRTSRRAAVQQSGLPQKGEWRLLAILWQFPCLHTALSAQVIEIMTQKMPHLAQLCYLARAGADEEMLRDCLQDWQILDQVSQARLNLQALSAQDLQREWQDAVAQMQAEQEKLRARLEKLGM